MIDRFNSMGVAELNAMLIQDVAHEIRELDRSCTAESGRLYQGDNGRWYFYVGI